VFYVATFGQRLKLLREQKRLIQKQVSDVLGVSESPIGKYENDQRTPPPDTITKLADFFSVTTDYLLGHTDSLYVALPPVEQKQPKDLTKFLEQSEVMFDGETYHLDEEDKGKLRAAEVIFMQLVESSRKYMKQIGLGISQKFLLVKRLRLKAGKKSNRLLIVDAVRL
jgi:transcriptional regulator with XRE-family HTH domain